MDFLGGRGDDLEDHAGPFQQFTTAGRGGGEHDGHAPEWRESAGRIKPGLRAISMRRDEPTPPNCWTIRTLLIPLHRDQPDPPHPRQRSPTVSSAASEVAALRAKKELPKGVIHVISDVHGEKPRARHVINNASGRLRPLVMEIFGKSLSRPDFQEFINVLYYPAEVIRLKKPALLADPGAPRDLGENHA